MLKIKILLPFCLSFSLLACQQNSKQAAKSEKGTSARNETKKSSSRKNILFFGDSLTAGYGLDDVSEAFPALIQDKIDSLHLDYKTINGGVSGETSAGGNSRIDFLLKPWIDV